MFEAEELRTILDNADMPLKAIILLGINCGFGATDVANLPMTAFDFNRQIVDFPRPKTAVERHCTLWPETIEAVKEAIENRKTPKDKTYEHLVFITKYGNRWVRSPENGGQVDSVGAAFSKLLTDLNLKRPGLSFYALRHTFETIGGESRDQVAVNHIMGHADNSMAAVYRERISDERLKAVTDYVHQWLFDAKQ